MVIQQCSHIESGNLGGNVPSKVSNIAPEVFRPPGSADSASAVCGNRDLSPSQLLKLALDCGAPSPDALNPEAALIALPGRGEE